MLACKGIFAKPSIARVRKAHSGTATKTYEVRLSDNIISHSVSNVNIDHVFAVGNISIAPLHESAPDAIASHAVSISCAIP